MPSRKAGSSRFWTERISDDKYYRGLRLFWPLAHGFSARLCKTGGVADACCLVGALLAIGVAVWRTLP